VCSVIRQTGALKKSYYKPCSIAPALTCESVLQFQKFYVVAGGIREETM
jgi:hypothetical protein